MARNTRGKLKENLEGVHRNCEWIKQHCDKSLLILPDGYETLKASFEGLIEINEQLDKFAQLIYSKV